MKKLVLASSNAGKLREIQALLAPLGCEVLTQADMGIADAEEPHPSFIENALAKARHVAQISGLPALADDSGVCVLALGGEPGVHSARYAGNAAGREERDARLKSSSEATGWRFAMTIMSPGLNPAWKA
jgi:XTP/dITP diphosphohydrolase